MIRSWGIVTLTTAAQPWFYDITTAAVALPDGNGIIKVTVASTTKYQVGDRIQVDPGQTDQDTLLVELIFSATVLYCKSEGNAKTHTHVTSTVICLDIACMDVLITNFSAADKVFIGSDSTVTATPGGSAFTAIGDYTSPASPSVFRLAGSIGGANTCRTTDGWMIGTNGQTVGVAAVVL